MNATPLGYLTAFGRRADVIAPLTWFTLAVSIVVCLIIAVLLGLAVSGARRGDAAGATAAVPVERGGDGLRWISLGLAFTAVPLAVTLVWTMAALAQVAGPPARPSLVIDVTGHQWWWEANYNGRDPSDRFATANELHIPVGVPVLVRLHSQDVIHSFWVPKLSGKTDTIPGQNNLAWLEADRPGRYRGQCTEFCGLEHAKMAFEIVADEPGDFARWRVAQLRSAAAPATPEQARGLAVVEYRCGLCHAVRGTEAGSHYGPDLTHLMSRRMIASGVLPNNPGALAGWIQNPQGVKPGTLMPNQYLTGQQLQDVGTYLETLR